MEGRERAEQQQIHHVTAASSSSFLAPHATGAHAPSHSPSHDVISRVGRDAWSDRAHPLTPSIAHAECSHGSLLLHSSTELHESGSSSPITQGKSGHAPHSHASHQHTGPCPSALMPLSPSSSCTSLCMVAALTLLRSIHSLGAGPFSPPPFGQDRRQPSSLRQVGTHPFIHRVA